MTSLNTTSPLRVYDFIEVGDYIEKPNSFLLVKSGIVASIRKWNGHAMRVTLTNGSVLELSKYKRDFVIWQEA